MGKIIRWLMETLKRFLKTIKYLKKVYKYGGYTTVNVSSVNYGGILKDKRVLITGGSNGIGLSIAKKCISEGAIVLITGRNESTLVKAKAEIGSENLMTFVWDISKIGEISQESDKAIQLLGGDIDIIVNNAGIIDGTNFPEVKEEIWDRIYATNSKAVFFLTQTICKKWMNTRASQIKKVINISSQGGFIGATYPYRMTKWDIAGLTQGLGIKLAPYGIIVNGIAPGIITTRMQPNFLEQEENVYCSLNPLERVALPEEIAELALFLISDASNFIVGQTIVCDGGFILK